MVALQEFSDDNWDSQLKSARAINQVKHPNILSGLGSLRIGTRNLIIYEWRRGEALSEFWLRKRDPVLEADLVSKVLDELVNLADALCVIHKNGHSHGALMPEAILISQDGSLFGKLQLTGLRSSGDYPTSNSPQFLAPELVAGSSSDRPPSADVWSFGCIILEFMIWLLYGTEALEYFQTCLIHSESHGSTFYQVTENGNERSVELDRSVVTYMNVMATDPECFGRTALGDLLWILKNDLLVIEDHAYSESKNGPAARASFRRATASSVLTRLRRIREIGKSNATYLFTCSDRPELFWSGLDGSKVLRLRGDGVQIGAGSSVSHSDQELYNYRS